MKRVAVVGMGIKSALGCSVDAAFLRLHTYQNCVKCIEELEQYKNLNTRLGAPIEDFREPDFFNRKITRTMGRVARLATTSAIEALEDAGLIDDKIIQNGKTGISYGSSSGSIDTLMDFYAMCVNKELTNLNSGSYIKMMPQTTTVNLSLYFKTTGRIIPTSTACTSGSMGIGAAYELIRDGVQTVMIAGGAEEFHPTQIGIFDTLYATSTKNGEPDLTPAPFDKNRDGLVIGEGAGTLILEEMDHARARGAKIYAEIAGYATNTDGTHITNPNSRTMALVIKKALECANIDPSDIGYINAHGTGTLQGDIAESRATKEAFGNTRVPVSTIKSYTGHTLGACGAIEAILSIEMMRKKWFSPNLNLKDIDTQCAELDYIAGCGREIDAEFVMSNNFAFGGINTSLIFKRV